MNQIIFKRMMQVILPAILLATAAATLAFLQVNHIRGDEFLSYMHSNPVFHKNIFKVMQHIKAGADNSYIHAGLVFISFKLFEPSMLVQRCLSWLCFGGGLFFCYRIMQLHTKQIVHNLFFVCLIATSNMAFMLATDGRFYSILFLLSTCLLFIILKNPKQWLTPIALLLLSYFTGVITFIWGLWITIALFIHQRNKNWAFIFGGCTLIYFLFFSISYFNHHFFNWQFTAKSSDGISASYFLGYPFRFFGVSGFFESDMFNGAITGLALLALFIKGAVKNKSFSVIDYLSLSLAAGLLLQLCLYLFIDLPLWPYRYYGGFFFVWILSLHARVQLTANQTTLWLSIFCSLFMLSRSLKELQKVEQRASNTFTEVLFNQTGKNNRLVFLESFEQYQTFSYFGSMYIKYPMLRSQLFIGIDNQSVTRNTYFRKLQDQGNFIQLLTKQEIIAGDILVTADSSNFYRYKTTNRVLVIPKD